mmetsp:Transcript_19982/g.68654  ORF Transcript_19982/g.68654 Transcript_19982/m.68654 type:complete len:220 (+) Transcript_19982:490-1149(+)
MLHDTFQQQAVRLVLAEELRSEADARLPLSEPLPERRRGPAQTFQRRLRGVRRYYPDGGRDELEDLDDGLLERAVVEAGVWEIEVHLFDVRDGLVDAPLCAVGGIAAERVEERGHSDSEGGAHGANVYCRRHYRRHRRNLAQQQACPRVARALVGPPREQSARRGRVLGRARHLAFVSVMQRQVRQRLRLVRIGGEAALEHLYGLVVAAHGDQSRAEVI